MGLTPSQRWYRENKEYVKAQAKLAKDKLVLEVNELKQNTPCMDCGISYPYYVMDFDHVRGVKLGNVADLLRVKGRKKVLEEIDKCDIVCSNCHRQRTYERQASIA